MGDKYEAARIKMKNPDGPPPKGAKAAPKAKAKAAPKAKPTKAKAAPAKAGSKRKKGGDDDDDDDAQEGDENEEDEDEDTKPPPAKRGRKAAAPAKTAKGKGKEEDGDEDEEDGEEGDDEEAPAGKSVPELLLANKWDLDTGLDPTGWWVSEKLDGVRYALSPLYVPEKITYISIVPITTETSSSADWAIHSHHLTGSSTVYLSFIPNDSTPSDQFLSQELPTDVTLDGELYGGRGNFQSTVSIVKTVNSVHWKNITFQVRQTSPCLFHSYLFSSPAFRYPL